MFNELNNLFPTIQNIFKEEDEQTFKRQFSYDELEEPHDLFPNNSLIDLVPFFNPYSSDLSKNEDSSPSPCESTLLTTTFLFSRANSKVFDDLKQNSTLYKPHKIILKAVFETKGEDLDFSQSEPELKLVKKSDNSVENITFELLKKEVTGNKVEILFNKINFQRVRCSSVRSRRPQHIFQISIGLINSQNKKFTETIQSEAFQIFARKPTASVKETLISNLELQELLDYNFSL